MGEKVEMKMRRREGEGIRTKAQILDSNKEGRDTEKCRVGQKHKYGLLKDVLIVCFSIFLMVGVLSI